jgi:hypothetical protein
MMFTVLDSPAQTRCGCSRRAAHFVVIIDDLVIESITPLDRIVRVIVHEGNLIDASDDVLGISVGQRVLGPFGSLAPGLRLRVFVHPGRGLAPAFAGRHVVVNVAPAVVSLLFLVLRDFFKTAALVAQLQCSSIGASRSASCTPCRLQQTLTEEKKE